MPVQVVVVTCRVVTVVVTDGSVVVKDGPVVVRSAGSWARRSPGARVFLPTLTVRHWKESPPRWSPSSLGCFLGAYEQITDETRTVEPVHERVDDVAQPPDDPAADGVELPSDLGTHLLGVVPGNHPVADDLEVDIREP